MQNISNFFIHCIYYSVEYIKKLFCLYLGCFWEVFELCCMAQLVFSPSRKKITPMNVVGITNVHQKMFVACIEGYIINMYVFVDVPKNGF